MSRTAWLASELTKVGWRAKHPATVAAWAAIEDGAREATLTPRRRCAKALSLVRGGAGIPVDAPAVWPLPRLRHAAGCGTKSGHGGSFKTDSTRRHDDIRLRR